MIARLVALCLLLGLPALAFADAPRRFAIVVGANDGGQGRAVLRYAASDAERFSGVMQRLGGVTPADVTTLVDPSPDDVIQAFGQLQTSLLQAEGRVEVFFYYSGHSDEQGLLLRDGQRVTYRDLRAQVDALRADVRVMVLDSCSAGALTRAKGGARRPALSIDEVNDVQGHAFLTSSSIDEVAQESDRIKGSFFTHYLITGLQGAADASSDRRVTLSEAYQFAFRETLARTESTRGGPQHAGYEIQLTGVGDLVLTDLRQTSATLALGPPAGRLHVHHTERRTLVAELEHSGQPLELHVEPGRYTLLVTSPGSLQRAFAEVREGERLTIDAADYEAIEREQTTARGDGWPAALIDPALEVTYTPIGFHFGLVTGAGSNDALASGPIRNQTFIQALVGGVGSIHGFGLAGLLGWVDGDMKGVMITGLGGWMGELKGVGLSGVFSRVERVRGLQLSGVVNVTDRIRGLQIGLINVAGEVEGAQLGLVNISDSPGASLGLFNYAEGGILAAELWASETSMINAGFRIGTPHFYTQLGVGLLSFAPDEASQGGEVSFAIGGRVPLGASLALDADAQASQTFTQGGWHADLLLTRARLAVRYELASWFALYAGASIGASLSFGADPTTLSEGMPRWSVYDAPGVEGIGLSKIELFPGFFGGVEF